MNEEEIIINLAVVAVAGGGEMEMVVTERIIEVLEIEIATETEIDHDESDLGVKREAHHVGDHLSAVPVRSDRQSQEPRGVNDPPTPREENVIEVLLLRQPNEAPPSPWKSRE